MTAHAFQAGLPPGQRQQMAGGEPPVSLRDILGVLFQRKWTVFLMFFLVVAAATLIVMVLLSPRYEASATLTIQPSSLINPLADGAQQSDIEKALAFNTQKDVIASARIAAAVVDRLELASRRKPARSEQIAAWFRLQFGERLGITSMTQPVDSRAVAITALQDHLELIGRPDSLAIKINYQAYDPAEAAETLNAVVDEYSRYYYGQIQSRAAGLLEYIDQRLQTAQDKLVMSERALLAFRHSDTLVVKPTPGGTAASVPQAANRPAPNLPPATATGLPTALFKAGIVGVTDSVQVQNDIKSQVLNMEDELRKLLAEYPESHRSVRDLRDRIAIYNDTMAAIPGRELELGRLRRELEVNQNAFLELRKSLDRARLIASGNAEAVRLINVVDVASINPTPVAPKPRVAIGLAVCFGLVFGVIAAFVLEFIDHRVRSVRDIESLIGVHLIASIEELKL
jgi:uncharacterized protein involved in exopolysaccharide biosynthesis